MIAKKKTRQLQDELMGSAHRVWLAGLGAMAMAEQESNKLFKALVERGESVEVSGKETVEKAKGTVAGMKTVAESYWETFERTLDDQVTAVIHRVGVPTKSRDRGAHQEGGAADREHREAARQAGRRQEGPGGQEVRPADNRSKVPSLSLPHAAPLPRDGAPFRCAVGPPPLRSGRERHGRHRRGRAEHPRHRRLRAAAGGLPGHVASPTAPPRGRSSSGRCPTSSCSTSSCRAWTASSCCRRLRSQSSDAAGRSS